MITLNLKVTFKRVLFLFNDLLFQLFLFFSSILCIITNLINYFNHIIFNFKDLLFVIINCVEKIYFSFSKRLIKLGFIECFKICFSISKMSEIGLIKKFVSIVQRVRVALKRFVILNVLVCKILIIIVLIRILYFYIIEFYFIIKALFNTRFTVVAFKNAQIK